MSTPQLSSFLLERGATMSKKEYILESIDDYDYGFTRSNVERIYERYRSYKERRKSVADSKGHNMDFDGLGIYTGRITDNTSRDGIELAKYNDYIEKLDKVYELNKHKLNHDELKIYKYYLEKRYNNEELCNILHCSMNPLSIKKKTCIIKVALWFGVAVDK